MPSNIRRFSGVVRRFAVQRLPIPVRIEALVVLVFALAAFYSPAPARATVKSGFTDSLVASISSPTDITFTPGGRLVVATQGGALYMMVSGSPVVILNLTAKVCSDFERGMLGVTFDPNFNDNHYIFVYYTFAKFGNCNHNTFTSPVNRVSRFTMSGNTVNAGSETVLLDNMAAPNGNHNAGDLLFGKDGYLYVSVGDGGCKIGDATKCGGQNTNSRSKNILNGKVLRITRDGGIPGGNPYTGSDSGRCNVDGKTSKTYCQETFAWGFRNPFRLALDPNSGSTKIYVNDVGQDVSEEIDLLASGKDYGWNTREGNCATGSSSNCGAPPSGMTNPVFAYFHDGCNSITGGAFVPNTTWPSDYTGGYMFADYVCGEIFMLKGSTRTVFGSNLGPVTTLTFGPFGNTQALYYGSYSGQIRRISSTTAINHPPVAAATADKTFGPLPLQVTFDGSGSTDQDHDTLTYDWDFKDSSPHGTGAKPVHTFTTAGSYNVSLTVSDGKGGSNSTTIKIDPGNTAPTAEIISPAADHLFAVGEEIMLTGSGTDEQDGTLADSQLSWVVHLHHDTHEHPWLSATGNNLTLSAPAPEDLLAATNSYLHIWLTATDSTGLATTVEMNLMPHKVNLTFASDPSGLQLQLEGTTIVTPKTVVSWENNPLDIAAPDQLLSNGEAVEWVDWSAGGDQSTQITTPDEDTTITAEYQLVPGQSFAPSADARVRENSPSTNEGKVTGLTTKGGSTSDYESFLRFDVSGLSGQVVSATLFLYDYDETTDGPAVFKTGSTWTETGITWSNRPASSGSALDDAGNVPFKTWIALDVTSAITGNGSFNLLLRSTSTDSAAFYSRESSSKQPRLVVVTNGGGSDTTAPSVPTGLAADAPNSRTAVLTWNASTDDTAVTGYDIFRNDVLLSSTGTTSYTDSSGAPGATYTYKVRARDAAGNRSDLSSGLQVHMPAQTVDVTYAPVADARVQESTPTKNYGTSTELRAEGGSDPDISSFIRFSVTGLPGGVYRAKLRVFIPAGSGNGTVDGPTLFRANSDSWSETGITWSTKPGFNGSAIADKGALAAGTWVEYDVSTIIHGNGPYSFALASASTDVVVFSSREGATPPQLVITAFGTSAAAAAAAEPAVVATSTSTPAATPLATATASAIADLPFSDGFEGGDLSNWTDAKNAAIETDVVKTGTSALLVQSQGSSKHTGEPSYATHPFATPQSELYAQTEVRVLSTGENDVELLTLLGGRDTAWITLLRTREGHLVFRNERTKDDFDLGEFSLDTWHTIQVHVIANASQSKVEIWVDGRLMHQAGERLYSGRLAAIRLGDSGKRHTFAATFDDVALDKVCIGTCSTELVTQTATATPVPTEVATEPAVESPTAAPTETPTEAPTQEPTVAPTETPTPEATTEATEEPTP